MFNSIRARMTAAFGIAITTLMLLTCLAITTYARYEAGESTDALLKSAAEKVAFELPVDNQGSSTELDEIEKALVADRMALVVVDSRGSVVSRAGHYASIWPRTPSGTEQETAGHKGGYKGEEWRTFQLPAKSYTIVIGTPWTQTGRNLRGLAIALIGLSLVVCTSVTLGAWLLVGKTLSPIGLLSQQARQHGKTSHEGQVQLDAPSHDAEVVELVATLNDLLVRQSATIAARGRFYAAASHELRTPLQALSGHLELALQRPRTGDEYHQVVQEAYTQTRRLTTLTRDLLRLHQLEGAPPPVQEGVDLSAIIERTLNSFETAIQERRLNIATSIPDHVIVAAAPTHADMIVRNLLENAVLYTPQEGNISLSLAPLETSGTDQDRDRVELIIANTCTSLPNRAKEKEKEGETGGGDKGTDERADEKSDEGASERLFEPFYRPDSSRTRLANGLGGGNGLGLAICKALAEVNGWDLTLNLAPKLYLGRALDNSVDNSMDSKPEQFVVHVVYRKGISPCVSSLG